MRQEHDVHLPASPDKYAHVMSLDRAYRALLDDVPDVCRVENASREALDPTIKWVRLVCVQGVHRRIAKLHRPWLLEGHKPGSPYRYSAAQCIASSKIVIFNLHASIGLTKFWSVLRFGNPADELRR